MRVLIVDDSRVMRMMVRRALRQTGAKIDAVEAEDGAKGLQALRSGTFDLVLSDWNMPEMSGLDFLRATRSDGNTVAFGLVTSEGSPSMRAAAATAGANFLIQKPFEPDDFEAVLAALA